MKFLTSLAIAVILTWSLAKVVGYEEPGDVLHLGKYRWTYTPLGEEKSYEFRPGGHISLGLPYDVQCCEGEFNTNLSTRDLAEFKKNKSSKVAIYFPAIGGKFLLHFNGNTVELPESDYSSVGPIVLLPDRIYQDALINLKITLNSGANSYAGLWKDAPYIGDFYKLQQIRDNNNLHQVLVPLASSILFAVVSITFFFIYVGTKWKYNQYKLFCLCILVWSLFFFSLSGVPRTWNYQIFSVLHFPIRSAAGLSLFVLIEYYISFLNGTSSDLRYLRSRIVIAAFLAIISLQIVTIFFGRPDLQNYMHPLVTILSFLPLFWGPRKEHEFGSTIYVFYTVIVTIFVSHASDSLRMLNGVWAIEYNYPFIDRYSTPVLLLTSVVIYFLNSFSLFDDLSRHYDRLKKFSSSALAMTSHKFNEQHFEIFSHEISSIMAAENCQIVRSADEISSNGYSFLSHGGMKHSTSNTVAIKKALLLEEAVTESEALKTKDGPGYLHKIAVPVPLGRRPDYVIYVEKFSKFRHVPDADIHNMELLSWLLSLQIEKSVSAHLSKKVVAYEKKILEQAKFEAIANTTQMLAHDIRRPFSFLKIMITLIQSSLSSDLVRQTVTELIPEIERNIETVDKMIKDLFEVGSNAPLDLQSTSLTRLVKLIVEDLRRLHPTTDVSFHYEFIDDHFTNMDTDKISRVLLNIIENAMESTTAGGTVTISISSVEILKKRFQQIKVHNFGKVIDESLLKVIFDEFFTNGKENGTGLGLAISKKIVEDHGGNIWCKSDLKSGTNFYFNLPV